MKMWTTCKQNNAFACFDLGAEIQWYSTTTLLPNHNFGHTVSVAKIKQLPKRALTKQSFPKTDCFAK